MKQYHYVVSYDENNGWLIDTYTEMSVFNNGTIYDTELDEWQFGYLGDDKFNGIEDELATQLSRKLNEMNGQ